MKLKYIVSFSGGKDSTAMLLMMIEKGIQIDEVINIDTTKEFPAMYRHIEKVKGLIYPIPMTIIPIKFDYWFGEHIKTRGKNKGKLGYGWCDFRNRWCTALKREAVKKYLKGKDYIDYRGIAFDEKHRTKNNKTEINIKYPLVEWKITETQALEYCYSKGFDWCGLYNEFVRVSCYCCPLSRIGELKTLYNKYPKLWNQIKKMDKLSYRQFRSDYSFEELEKKIVAGTCSKADEK